MMYFELDEIYGTDIKMMFFELNEIYLRWLRNLKAIKMYIGKSISRLIFSRICELYVLVTR